MLIGIDASRANVDKKTGTEWYAYYVIQEFKKIADPNDQFILYSKEKLRGSLSELPANFNNKVLNWPPKFLWTQIRLAWEMLVHKTDALFVPAHTIPLIHPKNTVTTLHDIGFEEYHQLYSPKDIGPENTAIKKIIKILVIIFTFGKYSSNELDYHRWSARLALKHAKRIITVSIFSKEKILEKFPINERKVSIIPNAYSPIYRVIHDQDKINAIKNEYNLTEPFFLYIGRQEEKKNVYKLIQAYLNFKKQSTNNFQLVLVGDKGYGYEKIAKLISSSSQKNNIKTLGWVDSKELPYLLNAAEIFIFPTLYEGFGIPILEAMACGTPVITSNYGAMKEISGQAAYLVNPNNLSEISSALNRLITDPNLKTNLITKGLQRVRDFSWSNTAKQTLTLIKE
ncbi:glycosyltransferase family 4 protein [Patescibacteria group bacterium]|nr:glycosyltransferase family 4 protein [Patescibacteria group bacterium]MBU0963653.1 glycosyltransferase family 4 protein [Patescibacteria group bacterium]